MFLQIRTLASVLLHTFSISPICCQLQSIFLHFFLPLIKYRSHTLWWNQLKVRMVQSLAESCFIFLGDQSIPTLINSYKGRNKQTMKKENYGWEVFRWKEEGEILKLWLLKFAVSCSLKQFLDLWLFFSLPNEHAMIFCFYCNAQIAVKGLGSYWQQLVYERGRILGIFREVFCILMHINELLPFHKTDVVNSRNYLQAVLLTIKKTARYDKGTAGKFDCPCIWYSLKTTLEEIKNKRRKKKGGDSLWQQSAA